MTHRTATHMSSGVSEVMSTPPTVPPFVLVVAEVAHTVAVIVPLFTVQVALFQLHPERFRFVGSAHVPPSSTIRRDVEPLPFGGN